MLSEGMSIYAFVENFISDGQDRPSLRADRTPPLLQLPLELPKDEHKVTDWAELNVNLPQLAALFRSVPPEAASESEDDEQGCKGPRLGGGNRGTRQRPPDLPSGYASTVSVRIYASCRLRRLWFSAEGDHSLDAAGVRDEWALYSTQ